MDSNFDISNAEAKYLDFVNAEAKKIGKVFFVDSGEGRDLIDPETGWYIEDLSGWLINNDELNDFISLRKNDAHENKYNKDYVLVKWKTNNCMIEVDFIEVTIY